MFNVAIGLRSRWLGNNLLSDDHVDFESSSGAEGVRFWNVIGLLAPCNMSSVLK